MLVINPSIATPDKLSVREISLHSNSHSILVNLIQNPNNPGRLGIIKNAKQSLIVNMGKGRFKQHCFIYSAVFGQMFCVSKRPTRPGIYAGLRG